MAIPNFITYKKILKKRNFLPFYVYDYNSLKRQIIKFKKNIPGNIRIFYVIKTNPNIAILKVIKKFNLGVVAVSLGELIVAKKTGFKTSDIFFAGSIKSDREILEALKNDISLFGLESLSEVQRMNKITKKMDKKSKVMLRFDASNFDPRGQNINKVFPATNFGISLRDIEKVIPLFSKNFSNLDLKGIHIYNGTRIYEVDISIRYIRDVFSVIKRLEEKFKFDFEKICIGGGFGSNVKQEFDEAVFLVKLKILLKEFNFDNKDIILELGRYLVNRSGVYVTEVIESKKRKNFNILVVGGMTNHLSRVIFKSNRDIQLLKESISDYGITILPERKGTLYPTSIRGQISSAIDIFGRNWICQYLLPKSRPGDFVIIKGVGAYGLTTAITLFGSKSLAAEFMLIDGKLELIRKNKTIDDFISDQKIPLALKRKKL
ncbi:MAG: hypothetical protein ABIC36_01490 [bacterium]